MKTGLAPMIALLIATVPAMALADDLVAIDDAERGTFVTLEGEVTDILDEDTFRLTDASGDIRVYIGPNRMPVRPGDAVTVNGFVDDDIIGPREVYADGIVMADGTAYTFDRGYE